MSSIVTKTIVVNGVSHNIKQRDDGWVSASNIVKIRKASIRDWLITQWYARAIFILFKPEEKHTEVGDYGELRGTWIHPKLARHCGEWVSTKVQAEIDKWLPGYKIDLIDPGESEGGQTETENEDEQQEIMDENAPNERAEPVVVFAPPQRKMTLHEVRAHQILEKTGFLMPTESQLMDELGFTKLERKMREESFGSLDSADEFRWISDEYACTHLTKYDKRHLKDYFHELETNNEFKQIIRILSKSELLKAPNSQNIAAGPTGGANDNLLKSELSGSSQALIIYKKTIPTDIFEKAPANRRFLFANREGIIRLHMKANSRKGEMWRAYFIKTELLSHMQSICYAIYETYIIKKEKQQLFLDKVASEERLAQERKAIEEKFAQERKAREDAEREAAAKQLENTRLLAQMRLVEQAQRFCPIADANAYYSPSEYLYIEASADEYRRCRLGFGKTSNLANRLNNYQSKSTGQARREYLKTWEVWNSSLLETILKEMLSPWATPGEKQKPIHLRKNNLSKIEIVDMPFTSLVELIDFTIAKFQVIINKFKQTVDSKIIVKTAEIHCAEVDAEEQTRPPGSTDVRPLPSFKPLSRTSKHQKYKDS